MKIFGIGLSRTGTKSLSTALNKLGFNVGHYECGMAAIGWKDGALTLDTTALEDLGGLTDIPAAAFFRELDAAFSDARFVVTVRDKQAWIQSISRHLSARSDTERYRAERNIARSAAEALRIKVYGAVDFELSAHSPAFDRHYCDVAEHFSDRPHKLLSLDICGGDGWSPLCRFLGVPVPEAEFPRKHARSRPVHHNQAQGRS